MAILSLDHPRVGPGGQSGCGGAGGGLDHRGLRAHLRPNDDRAGVPLAWVAGAVGEVCVNMASASACSLPTTSQRLVELDQ